MQENMSHYFKVGEGRHSVYQDWFDVVLEIRVVDVAEVEVAWLVLGRVVQAAQVCVGFFGAAEPYTWKKIFIFYQVFCFFLDNFFREGQAYQHWFWKFLKIWFWKKFLKFCFGIKNIVNLLENFFFHQKQIFSKIGRFICKHVQNQISSHFQNLGSMCWNY